MVHPGKRGILGLLVFSIVLSVSMTGCENENSISHDNSEEKQKTAITFWSWASHTDYIQTVYETAIGKFNMNNEFGVEIQPSYIPGEQYKTRIQTEMAANSAPDMMNVWAAGKMKPLVDNGRLYPLSDELNKDREWKSRYLDGVFDETTFDGVIYGIPQIRSASVLFYNKDLFSTYKIDVPENWTELIEAARAFRDRGKFALAYAGKDPWIGAMYAEYIVDRLDPEAYKRMMEDGNWSIPAYIETGEKIQELLKESAFPQEALKLDYISARRLFDEERAAMYLQGNWDVGYLSGTSPIRDRIGVLEFPEIEGGKGSKNSLLAGIEAVIAISSQCKNTKAAVAFLKYLSEDEIAKDLLVEKGGYLSTVRVAPDPGKLTALYKEVEGLFNSSQNNFGYYDVLLGPVVGEKFNIAIQSILTGTTPKDAFKKLSDITEAEISKNKN